MKAILAERTGGSDVMKLVEVATPQPSRDQLLVRVEAAGVNFIDIYHRSGQYKQPLPVRLGLEGAGVVEAVGDGVSDVKKGDRVGWASAPGSYATHAIVDAKNAVPVPANVDAKIAAATMLQGMTAHYLARSTHRLSSNDTCLVHAGAGGVGLLLTQIAKLAGATVISVVSTDEKAARAKSAGADHVVVSAREDFRARARTLTNDRGVTVAYDSVGKDTFERSLGSLARRGLLVLFGQASGAVPPFDLQGLSAGGSLFVTRPTLKDYTATRDELLARAADLFAWISEKKLQISIDSTFSLAEASAAHDKLQGRGTIGKVLLVP